MRAPELPPSVRSGGSQRPGEAPAVCRFDMEATETYWPWDSRDPPSLPARAPRKIFYSLPRLRLATLQGPNSSPASS